MFDKRIKEKCFLHTPYMKYPYLFYSEKQARRIHEGQDIKTIKKCGVLKNNEATVELLQCGTLSAKFKNLVSKI